MKTRIRISAAPKNYNTMYYSFKELHPPTRRVLDGRSILMLLGTSVPQGWGLRMRQPIADLVALGRLPSEQSVGGFADPVLLERYRARIHAIERPITDEDAVALVGLFGTDDCFGLAWTLLHLIETAPGWPIDDCRHSSDNEWIKRLKKRAENARRQG